MLIFTIHVCLDSPKYIQNKFTLYKIKIILCYGTFKILDNLNLHTYLFMYLYFAVNIMHYFDLFYIYNYININT